MLRLFYSKAYSRHHAGIPNVWDFLALLLMFSGLCGLAWLAKQMTGTYHLGQALPISLSPKALPGYAMHTVGRMLIALVFSLLFTLIFGTLAAKNKLAERIIIPLIDVLQSVPVLGFLSLTVMGFIQLFPESILGPECAAIFAIFVSQAWNMALSLYQSLRIVPTNMIEAAAVFQLSPWQRFWRVEFPFAIPGLLWNTMVSMSGAWFFIVAAEAISVANQNIMLPGIGSYIAKAIELRDVQAINYAVATMFIVILLYDQLFFRPLVCWSEKFKPTQDSPEETSTAWLIELLQKGRWIQRWQTLFSTFSHTFINLFPLKQYQPKIKSDALPTYGRYLFFLWLAAVTAIVALAFFFFFDFIHAHLTFNEVKQTFFLGLITCLRVLILIALSSLIWVPFGIWLGQKRQLAQFLQPVIQIMAAFPANLLFPAVTFFIVRHKLNIEIWTTPLMILGAQWYILFNVIAGMQALPKDLLQVSNNLGVRGWLRWQKVLLPAVYPYYITGAITAAGGAWNASIVAEYVHWGPTVLKATGLGAYITEYATQGDFPRLALGLGVMCFYVLLLNRLLWAPLYNQAHSRFQLS